MYQHPTPSPALPGKGREPEDFSRAMPRASKYGSLACGCNDLSHELLGLGQFQWSHRPRFAFNKSIMPAIRRPIVSYAPRPGVIPAAVARLAYRGRVVLPLVPVQLAAAGAAAEHTHDAAALRFAAATAASRVAAAPASRLAAAAALAANAVARAVVFLEHHRGAPAAAAVVAALHHAAAPHVGQTTGRCRHRGDQSVQHHRNPPRDAAIRTLIARYRRPG